MNRPHARRYLAALAGMAAAASCYATTGWQNGAAVAAGIVVVTLCVFLPDESGR